MLTLLYERPESQVWFFLLLLFKLRISLSTFWYEESKEKNYSSRNYRQRFADKKPVASRSQFSLFLCLHRMYEYERVSAACIVSLSFSFCKSDDANAERQEQNVSLKWVGETSWQKRAIEIDKRFKWQEEGTGCRVEWKSQKETGNLSNAEKGRGMNS